VAELQEQRLVAVRTRLGGITRPEQLHLAADPARPRVRSGSWPGS